MNHINEIVDYKVQNNVFWNNVEITVEKNVRNIIKNIVSNPIRRTVWRNVWRNVGYKYKSFDFNPIQQYKDNL
jgi:hypothetical protein